MSRKTIRCDELRAIIPFWRNCGSLTYQVLSDIYLIEGYLLHIWSYLVAIKIKVGVILWELQKRLK